MKVFTIVPVEGDEICRQVLIASAISVEPQIEIHIRRIGSLENGAASARYQMMADEIRHHVGECIFFTDPDIFYARPFLTALAREIREYDIAAAADVLNGPTNISQVAIRCETDTMRLFSRLAEMSRDAADPADLFHRELERSGLKHRALSHRFASTGIWNSLWESERKRSLSFRPNFESPNEDTRESRSRQLSAATAFLTRRSGGTPGEYGWNLEIRNSGKYAGPSP